MLTKEKQLSPDQAFFLGAYYAELWNINPSLAQHLVETFGGPDYLGSMMLWLEQTHLYAPFYQAFQIVGRYISDNRRIELANEVAQRIMCHDLRSYQSLARNPGSTHEVIATASDTVVSVTNATTAMAEALAGQDWQSFESTVARVSEQESRTIRALAESQPFVAR